MLKVLHTGDFHLGSFPSPEQNGENLRFLDLCHCLHVLLDEAREEQPDIAIIAGDLFHQARVWSDRGLKEQETAVKFLRELSAICPVVAMRGTPNHDSQAQFSALANTFQGNERVHVVWEPCVLPVTLPTGAGISVACLPGFDRGYYRAKHPGLSSEEENEVFTKAIEELIIGLKAQCTPGLPSVLVSHFTIAGANLESGQTAFFGQFEPVVYPATLTAAGFDLACFGHIHRPQQLDGCRNTFYCGAISQLNFNDEGQERGFYLHHINDDSSPISGNSRVVVSTFHRLPTREHLTIRLNDDDIRELNQGCEDWLTRLPVLAYNGQLDGKIVRVLYDCTDEHNKAFHHGALQNWLYQNGAFYVSEITPQKITITVDRQSMEPDSTPESNLTAYLSEKDMKPERIGELVELARPIIAEATEKATQQRHMGLFTPQWIEVHNYRNYRDERFCFDSIRFCTINGCNGAGKSTLFMDAMLDALFEEPREGDLTGWICNDPDVRSGSIRFTFGLGESTYRVTRTRMKSGKATLNLSELVKGEWEDRSKEKIRDTQQEIRNLIGMDSLTLKACALIMQDQYGLFLQADKEARMAILGNILGLGIYGDMETIAAERATETNRAIRSLADKVETMTAALPDGEELDAQMEEQEQRHKAAETAVQTKTKEVDGLKVALNTQHEIDRRIGRLNDKITVLTKQQTAKEAVKAGQLSILQAADTVLAQKPEIMAGVVAYNALLEQEKELIQGKATYDSLTARKRKTVAEIQQHRQEADSAARKAEMLTATKIEPLRQFLARTEELSAQHAEYENIIARITAMESAASEYEGKKKAVMTAEEALSRIEQSYRLQGAQLTLCIQGLQEKVALLANSGCPDTERASCRFLSDALQAKAKLPAVLAEEAALRQEHEQATAKATQALSAAHKALDDCIYSPEMIATLRAAQRKYQDAERAYQSLAARRSELQAQEERLAELEQIKAEAQAATKQVSAELEQLETQLTAYATANEDYNRLQQAISSARRWLEREKQLPVAQEQKTAAAQRVLELESEIALLHQDLAETQSELLEERSKATGTEALQEQVDRIEADIKRLNQQAQQALMVLGGLQQQAEEREKCLATAQGYQDRINALAGKAAGYEELKKAFSQDGIPHHIIRSIIPVFEATATNILGQMSGGRMSVELVTEKTLKSNSKKEVTTLDIIINDTNTGRLPYMSRSGGERVKAALSVILALSEIKSTKAGIQLGFLAIDEPPFLDNEGTQAYCTALETIQTRYPDTKVLAISHDETFKARFPQSVTVYKDESGSHVKVD